ncbi:MAG: nicotinamide riboside transporter PnuC [Bacteroidota bacterium]
MLETVLEELVQGIQRTTGREFIAIAAGIASVWFSKKESVWVYPIGLINTIIYVWMSFENDLIGEASVNFYYTVMSVYGWFEWSRRDKQKQVLLRVTYSSKKEQTQQLLFFLFCLTVLFLSISYLKQEFFDGAIPWADSLAAATAFTGMWLMTRKKVESWYWWVATNLVSIPLYFTKSMVSTSLYYVILLFLAIAGLYDWKKRANA